jgi:hypothetical protein
VTGRLLYVENGRLVARRLELDPPRLEGEPALLAENIGVTAGNAHFSLSTGSTLFGCESEEGCPLLDENVVRSCRATERWAKRRA